MAVVVSPSLPVVIDIRAIFLIGTAVLILGICHRRLRIGSKGGGAANQSYNSQNIAEFFSSYDVFHMSLPPWMRFAFP